MDFTEEITPGGVLLKILFKTWQFLAFNKKGSSIYSDDQGRRVIHDVPIVVFLGKSFRILKNYEQDFFLLKVRNGVMIIPYINISDNKRKYLFIENESNLDMIPVRLMHIQSVPVMVRQLETAVTPDYIVADKSITSNDLIIVKNRYKVENIIRIKSEDSNFNKEAEDEYDENMNLNMLSRNPVFLSKIHLRSLELSKVNQLLLDFDLTDLDTEYIIVFIEQLLKQEDKPEIKKNLPMLKNLENSFRFYHCLLNRDDERVEEMIKSQTSLKQLSPFRTLVSKVKADHPGREEQLLLTEYENLIMDKRGELEKN